MVQITEEDKLDKIQKEIKNGNTMVMIGMGLLLIFFGILVIAPTFNWDTKLIAAIAVLFGIVLVVWEGKQFF